MTPFSRSTLAPESVRRETNLITHQVLFWVSGSQLIGFLRQLSILVQIFCQELSELVSLAILFKKSSASGCNNSAASSAVICVPPRSITSLRVIGRGAPLLLGSNTHPCLSALTTPSKSKG